MTPPCFSRLNHLIKVRAGGGITMPSTGAEAMYSAKHGAPVAVGEAVSFCGTPLSLQ